MVIHEAHVRRFKGIDDVHLTDLSQVNAFYGRNNSGKSTILHALDMAGLALSTRNWNAFQPKLEIKDLFQTAGPFEIDLTYSDGNHAIVRQQDKGFGPTFQPNPTEEQRFRSIYIIPDPGIGLLRRHRSTPRNIMDQVQARNFSEVNGLEILFALKYYAGRRERGLKSEDYERIIADVKDFFPEIQDLVSDRTEDDIATLNYREYDRNLDVIYSGAGLKHFIDIFVKVALSQASVVLIDEPEMGLHPSLQRELLAHFYELAQTKGIQIFVATHSPVFLTDPDKVSAFCVQNRRGQRKVFLIPSESLHTIWGDLGLHPSDFLQNDIVLLVEGQMDVIFFDHVINELYREEFQDIAVGVVQYGGGAADGIVKGTIDISNIVPGHTYRLWIRDRDASPNEIPSKAATDFGKALKKNREKYHILTKREIEFYIPEAAYVEAQKGDLNKEAAIKQILQSDQREKFCNAVSCRDCIIPRGTYLRTLLRQHLSKDNLESELATLVEGTLLSWCDEILGKARTS